jgi:hypothetical protein
MSGANGNGMTDGGKTTMLDAFFERKLDVTVALGELATLANDVGAKSLKERVDTTLVKKLEEVVAAERETRSITSRSVTPRRS